MFESLKTKIAKKTATGNCRPYYDMVDSFIAVGEKCDKCNMYYTAVHSTGLWFSISKVDGGIIPICFIRWMDINYVVVDNDNNMTYIVPKNFQAIWSQLPSFVRMYKHFITHQMSESGEIAFAVSLSLYSTDIIQCLEDNEKAVYSTEPVTRGQKRRRYLSIVAGVIFCILSIYKAIWG